MLNSLDPRAILLSLALISIIIAPLQSLCAACAALLFSMPFLFFSGLTLRFIFKRVLTANLFIIFIWLIAPFTTPGSAIWSISFISISSQGLILATLTTLKANALIFLFTALAAPMPVSKFGAGLAGLRCPAKLVWILLMLERNIDILRKEWRRLLDAAKLRGFTPATSLYSYRVIASLLALLLIRANMRGALMLEAMKLRGFSGRFPVEEVRSGFWDIAFIAFMALLSCFLLFLEFSHV